MPQHKHYKAKQEMRLDCGHTIQDGETFHVSSVFTCDREGSWPLRILMACFAPKAKPQPAMSPAQPDKKQVTESKPVTQSKDDTQTSGKAQV